MSDGIVIELVLFCSYDDVLDTEDLLLVLQRSNVVLLWLLEVVFSFLVELESVVLLVDHSSSVELLSELNDGELPVSVAGICSDGIDFSDRL